MIVNWMLRMATASLLAGLAALVLDRAVFMAGGARRWVWAGGIGVVLSLPLLSWLLPSFPVTALIEGVPQLGIGLAVGPGAQASAGAAGSGLPLAEVAVWFWILGGAVCLVLYAAGWWRLARARRAWRAGNVAGTAVLVSSGAGPAAVGVLQPAIVVPEWLLSEDDVIQRLVVLHETEHLAAGDHLLLAMVPLAVVVMPWNPVLWWMVRRLRLAVELDCDRRVLSRGVEAGTYGMLLLDVAGRRGVGLLSIAMASPRSNLEARILALTAGFTGRRTRRVIAHSAFALLLAVVACEVAPGALLGPAAVADTILRKPALADIIAGYADADTRYAIDGEPATKSDVLSLDPSRVAHIAVREQARVMGEGPVSDTTREARVIVVTTPEYEALHPSPEAEQMAGVTMDQSVRDIVHTLVGRMPGERVEIQVDGHVVEPDALSEYDGRSARAVEVVRKRSGTESSAAIRIRTEAPVN